MKELDPMVFLAVFQEMLGPMLWVMLFAALAAVVAFVALVMREKGIVSRRLVRAELLGLIGGVVALVIMARVSSSGFTDAGGPADWFLIALVYGVGAVATVILTDVTDQHKFQPFIGELAQPMAALLFAGLAIVLALRLPNTENGLAGAVSTADWQPHRLSASALRARVVSLVFMVCSSGKCGGGPRGRWCGAGGAAADPSGSGLQCELMLLVCV